MAGMQFIGVDRRAKEARAALNRLRWEVDYAIDQGRAPSAATGDLAEAVGIMTNIMRVLAAALPEQPTNELEELLGSARARFLEQAKFYTDYHKVGR